MVVGDQPITERRRRSRGCGPAQRRTRRELPADPGERRRSAGVEAALHRRHGRTPSTAHPVRRSPRFPTRRPTAPRRRPPRRRSRSASSPTSPLKSLVPGRRRWRTYPGRQRRTTRSHGWRRPTSGRAPRPPRRRQPPTPRRARLPIVTHGRSPVGLPWSDSSMMSPTMASRTSSIVTMPTVWRCSSLTTATWRRARRQQHCRDHARAGP